MVSRSGLTVAKGQILVSTTSLEKRKIAGVLVCLHKYVGGAKMGRTYLTMIHPNSTMEGGAEQILHLAFQVEKGG